MNVLHTTLQNALEQIQGVHPLLHCISNIVTANDCANLALAIGASPIMAQEPQEMPQIAALAKAVILNTGTPDEAKFQAAAIAGKTANQLHIPVILDPVGIGASTWRLNHIHDLLSQVHPDILRVNLGEAKALLGQTGTEHGVDILRITTVLQCWPMYQLRLQAEGILKLVILIDYLSHHSGYFPGAIG